MTIEQAKEIAKPYFRIYNVSKLYVSNQGICFFEDMTSLGYPCIEVIYEELENKNEE